MNYKHRLINYIHSEETESTCRVSRASRATRCDTLEDSFNPFTIINNASI